MASLALAALWPWASAASAAAFGAVAPVNQTEALRQIHAETGLGLFATGARGALYRWAPGAASATDVARLLDPQSPLAGGHGRVAARRADGGLLVLAQGRLQGSKGVRLAQHAGLLVLPLAVIAVAVGTDGRQHRLIRLEPDAGGHWREVARSAAAVLPDARPVQVDLDGSGEGGHIAVLAGPDSERYGHAVLGDGIEATQVLWLERHALTPLRQMDLQAPYVFEDTVLRPVKLDGAEGLLTVRSGPQGGQLALLARDPKRADALQLRALGDPVGGRHRWLSPTTDGQRWLAVHTPHIGGVLHEYRLDGDQLARRALTKDVSTHLIGSRELDLSVWLGSKLMLPSQDGRRLRVFDAAAGFAEAASVALPGRVTMARAWPDASAVVVLLDDGRAVQVAA